MKILLFILCAVAPAWAQNCADELSRYEAFQMRDRTPESDLAKFQPAAGIVVTQRDAHGNAAAGLIRVLADNAGSEIRVVSELGASEKLSAVSGTPYFEGPIALRHNMTYRLVVNGRELLDPAGDTVAHWPTTLRSVFWDFDRPGAYRMTAPIPDLRAKFPVVVESGVQELVRRWRGGPDLKQHTYRYIAESGVIAQLASMGYNAIEFLPYNVSVDGEAWQLRYQVFGLYGPDSRYGTPEDFMRMVDAFHRAGIAVVMDAVIAHYPHSGGRGLAGSGLHHFRNLDGRAVYGEGASPWGTSRYDFENPYVRTFLTEAVLTNMRRYGISGVRVDNVDGIRHAGGGYALLRQLGESVRRYRPEALLIAEMFDGDSPVTGATARGGMGFSHRTDTAFFEFILRFWRGRTEEVDMQFLRHVLRGPWAWGEMAGMLFTTNHDEAANHRMGATGAYPASLLGGGGWQYIEGKTRAFGSLAMLAGAAYLELPQLRLMQEGTMGLNPDIDWALLREPRHARMAAYFARLSRVVNSRPEFGFSNLHPNIENHIDEENKVVSLVRIDHATGKKIYALINLGHHSIPDYRFGVDVSGDFTVLVDSDGKMPGILASEATPFHGQGRSVVVPRLAPYGVVLVEAR